MITIPDIDDFTIQAAARDVFLLCPTTNCPAKWVTVTERSIGDARDAADEHIRAHHLPKLPADQRYCAGCYTPIPTHRSFGFWCGDCAQ